MSVAQLSPACSEVVSVPRFIILDQFLFPSKELCLKLFQKENLDIEEFKIPSIGLSISFGHNKNEKQKFNHQKPHGNRRKGTKYEKISENVLTLLVLGGSDLPLLLNYDCGFS